MKLTVREPYQPETPQEVIDRAIIVHEALKTLRVWTRGEPIPEWLSGVVYWEEES